MSFSKSASTFLLIVASAVPATTQTVVRNGKVVRPKPKVTIISQESITPFPTESEKKRVNKWAEEFTKRGFEVVPYVDGDFKLTEDQSHVLYYGQADFIIMPQGYAKESSTRTVDMGTSGYVNSDGSFSANRSSFDMNLTTTNVEIHVYLFNDMVTPVKTFSAASTAWVGNSDHGAIRDVSKVFLKWFEENEDGLRKVIEGRK